MHEYTCLPSFQFPLGMWENRLDREGKPSRGHGERGEHRVGGGCSDKDIG